MKRLLPGLAVVAVTLATLTLAASAAPIRPLAQEHVVLGESPARCEVPLYSPTILRLPSGRLVAGYTQASRDAAIHGRSAELLFTSDDRGRTWTKRAELPALQGRVFAAGGRLYYVATGAGMPISRSDDEGLARKFHTLLCHDSTLWALKPSS